MSLEPSISNDCCLLTNIDLNSHRIRQLLERRFKNNSQRTSFDFKSFPPEQPSTNAKVSRSFLRFQPKIQFTDDSEENLSSDSDSSEEQEEDIEDIISTNDDDYYKELAEWQPSSFQPMIETDDDEEDEPENIPESVMEKNNIEDSPTNQMDHSSVQDAPTTHVEDLLVTFIHRPVKSEPICYDDSVFNHPPQLDGHIDLSPTQSSNEPNENNKEKDLNDIIAKINKRNHTTKKTIQLHKLPSVPTKFRLTEREEKKPANQILRKSLSSPSKTDRPKPQSIKDGKQTKKPAPLLYKSVLKMNEDAIRECDSRIPSIQTNNQKSSRTSSSNIFQSTTNKQQDPRKLISQQQLFKSSSITKQKGVADNHRCSSQSKEKSASDHMKLAQRKLNHFQEHHHLNSSIPSNSDSNPLSMKSKSKENYKTSAKPSKSIDTLVRRSASISKSPSLNDHNQKVKKKIKKPKRLNTEQANNPFRTKDSLYSTSKKQKGIEHDVVNKQQLTNHRSEPSVVTTSSIAKIDKRSANYFDGCIAIDDDDEEEQHNNTEDDDIQEIERQQYSITYDIRAREKDLDHIVHSTVMHIKWLFNLEYLLLDHILICHEKNLRPLNKAYENSVIIKCEYPTNSSIYHIDPTFISTVIINFLKIFLLRNASNDQQEFIFVQFGITSHLRYLLIELPTYNHNEEKDFNNDCSTCHQYSLIINILFDLLLDLMEYDLCEINTKTKYRSSLIEDDYFTRFFQSKRTKKNPFYRIKLVIYFIELIGIHMNKCQSKKQFQFNTNEEKLFHSIQDFIRHIISHINNLTNERISICFNVMELCLLFVNEKQIRMKEMSLFLAELCKDDLTYLNLFLFDENLFVDIRLLLINELIWKKFNLKFISINDINAFFRQIQDILNLEVPIDESTLILIRSLLNTYADLIIEIKTIPAMYSNYIQQITIILRNQFELVFRRLLDIHCDDSDYFKKIKRTLMLYHLLKCKCNKL